MNGLGRVRLFLCMIALILVLAPFALETLAQDSGSVAPTRQTKTRFSDSGSTAKNSGSKKAPVQNPIVHSACGPSTAGYSVHLNENPSPDAPGPGEALVYFIHDAGTAIGRPLGYPTTLIGLDGAWIGANHGDSYFSVSVKPGEHHVCAAIQSSLVDQNVELAHFTAHEGQTFFFRTRFIESSTGELIDLEPIDSDQGIYLAGTFPLSESKPKK